MHTYLLILSKLESTQYREYTYVDVVPLKCHMHSCAPGTDLLHPFLEFTDPYPLVICLTSSNF